MAAQKPLHQLLQEDQEPFLLTNYIADRRFQLNKRSPARRAQLQVKKLRPVSVSHNFCFFSMNTSPHYVKSPIFEFKSPEAKSPCRKTANSSSIFLHVPAKTASLLLEAVVKIQKQNQRKSSSSSKVAKSNNAFGLFGSLIKRITHRKKREIRGGGSVKDIIHRRRKLEDEKLRFSSDLETSSSSQSDGEDEDEDEEEEEEFVAKLIDSGGISDFASFDDHFCESPFHFVLRRSPSSGHRTPVFTSPATSPIKGKEKNQVQKEEEEEEEEEEDKEQNSPVSVLDPPFEDDDEGHDHHCEDDGFDLECSYAFVQRAKQQLLQKLRRFEKLAELDPVELEKRMHKEEQETDDDFMDEEEQEQEQSIHDMTMEQLGQTSFGRTRKIPPDMKRLVSDLINEEEGEQSYITDRDSMAKRICKRMEGWKEVECNTIDMMVEEDFKKQVDEWNKYQKQVGEAALEIEVSIFKVLVEELSDELVASIN